MRIGLIGFLAAGLLLTACGAAPGSAEWCETTPLEKQIEDPAAMAKCLDAE